MNTPKGFDFFNCACQTALPAKQAKRVEEHVNTISRLLFEYFAVDDPHICANTQARVYAYLAGKALGACQRIVKPEQRDALDAEFIEVVHAGADKYHEQVASGEMHPPRGKDDRK